MATFRPVIIMTARKYHYGARGTWALTARHGVQMEDGEVREEAPYGSDVITASLTIGQHLWDGLRLRATVTMEPDESNPSQTRAYVPRVEFGYAPDVFVGHDRLVRMALTVERLTPKPERDGPIGLAGSLRSMATALWGKQPGTVVWLEPEGDDPGEDLSAGKQVTVHPDGWQAVVNDTIARLTALSPGRTWGRTAEE